MTAKQLRLDALVVGGGISGMQVSLDLGDQGYKVALVEKSPSIGGNMIQLSKVFPTLDCASCITTPKMSSVAHHTNVDVLDYSEVQKVTPHGDGYIVEVLRKPRYVNTKTCTGCRLCESACPVDLPDQYEFGFNAHRTAYVPFPTAIPQKAIIDIDNCIFCGQCIKACPVPDCINFNQAPEIWEIEVKAIVLATGYKVTPYDAKKEYGAGKFRNVIDGLMMERLLAPTGPYGHVLRPSDGKLPGSIAYVQCAGSRDLTLGVPYCSRVCCMYAIKQAMLLAGALPLTDITIYYMDIRTFGKGYEQFYQSAKSMGINFVKAKVARITEGENQDLTLRVELLDENSQVEERHHDLVVLSVGMLPNYNPESMFSVSSSDYDGFVETQHCHIAPTQTTRPGIFAAGTATGPMDIVDSIVSASAAATEVAAYIQNQEGHDVEVSVENQTSMTERSAAHV
jgi:heterodisulfide reductase subunit A